MERGGLINLINFGKCRDCKNSIEMSLEDKTNGHIQFYCNDCFKCKKCGITGKKRGEYHKGRCFKCWECAECGEEASEKGNGIFRKATCSTCWHK